MAILDDGFPPIESPTARVLVLGTLPGQISLQHREYYAQPRNLFWRILGKLFAFSPELPYGERVGKLTENGVALWDVCFAASRPGSLDTSIQWSTIVPNDFAGFFASHREVNRVCFNGVSAAKIYRKLVLPKLPCSLRGLQYLALPSTSPANAAASYDDKYSQWSAIAGDLRSSESDR